MRRHPCGPCSLRGGQSAPSSAPTGCRSGEPRAHPRKGRVESPLNCLEKLRFDRAMRPSADEGSTALSLPGKTVMPPHRDCRRRLDATGRSTGRSWAARRLPRPDLVDAPNGAVPTIDGDRAEILNQELKWAELFEALPIPADGQLLTWLMPISWNRPGTMNRPQSRISVFVAEGEFSNGKIARPHPISAMPVSGRRNMLRGCRCMIIERIGVDIVNLELRTVIETIGWRSGDASDSQIY